MLHVSNSSQRQAFLLVPYQQPGDRPVNFKVCLLDYQIYVPSIRDDFGRKIITGHVLLLYPTRSVYAPPPLIN